VGVGVGTEPPVQAWPDDRHPHDGEGAENRKAPDRREKDRRSRGGTKVEGPRRRPLQTMGTPVHPPAHSQADEGIEEGLCGTDIGGHGHRAVEVGVHVKGHGRQDDEKCGVEQKGSQTDSKMGVVHGDSQLRGDGQRGGGSIAQIWAKVIAAWPCAWEEMGLKT